MFPSDCTQLDDFLDGDLDAAARRQFEAHLANCDACRQAVAIDRRLNHLFAASRPVSPPGLVERIDRRLRREQFARTAQRSGLLAAAALLVALGVWAASGPERRNSPPVPQLANAPSPEVHIRFTDETSVIAMPIKSKNPRVSIVWVYPTVRPPGQDSPSENNLETN